MREKTESAQPNIHDLIHNCSMIKKIRVDFFILNNIGFPMKRKLIRSNSKAGFSERGILETATKRSITQRLCHLT
jgi:hypothetical protein